MKTRKVSVSFTKRLRFALSLIFISLLIYSCNSNKKSTIANNQIDVEQAVGSGAILNLSDYASDIQYIPLETNEASVLGTIRDIAYESNKIYIRDNNNLVKIFDNSGKYLSTINRSGRGPQEYNRIGSFKPALLDRGVYILDSSGDLFLYELDGTFVEKRSLPKEESTRFSSFAFLDNNIFVATHSMNMSDLGAGNIDYNVFLLNDSLATISEKSFFQAEGVKTTMDGGKITSISISIRNIYIHKYDNQVRLLFDSQDTILTVNKEGVFKDAYVLNYGKYKENEEDNDMHTVGAVKKSIQITPPFFETENYLYLKFDFGEYAPEKIVTEKKGAEAFNGVSGVIGISGVTNAQTDANVNALFDKRSGKLILLNRPTLNTIGFVEDIKGGLPFWPRYMGSQGELISYTNALDIIDAAELDSKNSSFIKELSVKIKEDDNPVVVIVKPKK